METLKYEIKFLDDWICGSGLGAGAETDSEVIKDKDGLPYIPGKTIKGILKDACLEIVCLDTNEQFLTQNQINHIFGVDANAKEDGEKQAEPSKPGTAFFSNVELSRLEKEEIVKNQLQKFLYHNISSTRINRKGVAVDKSLRVTEVCAPITLFGEIQIEEEYHPALENAMRWTRRLGTNRNRGFGRCIIKKIEKK